LASDSRRAHLWAPILQSLGPGLLQEAHNALDYGEKMVAGWLEKRMFAGQADAESKAADIASYFTKASHKSHGRRISRVEAREKGLVIEDLEGDQVLQDWVLTLYHLTTIIFEKSPAAKILLSSTGNNWIKNLPVQQIQIPIPGMLPISGMPPIPGIPPAVPPGRPRP
ncbi:MAG: hypothetical protein AAGU16_05815, partial [Desulfitobacterium hafniense]